MSPPRCSRGAAELRERNDRDVQFLGERLQPARDGGDFLRAVFIALAAGRAGQRGGHELQIVDDDEVEAALLLLQAAGLGAHFGKRDAGRVVDVDAATR